MSQWTKDSIILILIWFRKLSHLRVGRWETVFGDCNSLDLSELTAKFRQAACVDPAEVYSLDLEVVSSIITAYTTKPANYPLLNILICFSAILSLMIEDKSQEEGEFTNRSFLIVTQGEATAAPGFAGSINNSVSSCLRITLPNVATSFSLFTSFGG